MRTYHTGRVNDICCEMNLSKANCLMMGVFNSRIVADGWTDTNIRGERAMMCLEDDGVESQSRTTETSTEQRQSKQTSLSSPHALTYPKTSHSQKH
jgi:hypothetical protein